MKAGPCSLLSSRLTVDIVAAASSGKIADVNVDVCVESKGVVHVLALKLDNSGGVIGTNDVPFREREVRKRLLMCEQFGKIAGVSHGQRGVNVINRKMKCSLASTEAAGEVNVEIGTKLVLGQRPVETTDGTCRANEERDTLAGIRQRKTSSGVAKGVDELPSRHSVLCLLESHGVVH